MLRHSNAIEQLRELHPDVAKTFREKVLELIETIRDVIREIFGKAHSEEAKAIVSELDRIAKLWSEAAVATAEVSGREIEVSPEVQQRIDNDQAINGIDEIKNSIRFDEKYMDAAEKRNKQTGFVSASVMRDAATARATVRDFFRDPENKEMLKLPADVTANTFYSDSSYGGSEENTTVCIRSMAAQQLMDEVSKNLGRPLTVQDTLLISQEIAALTDRPECFYCYVATDRRAYREYLGNYLTQRDEVIKKYRNGVDREALYTDFLNKRDDTPNMRARFNMWLNAVDNGTDLITGKDLASLEDLFAEVGKHKPKRTKVNGKSTIKLTGSRLDQLWDATSYAQSASWAKKMNGYAAYNNHILKWSQKRVDDLNKGYGLRMYSFSDYSPAFVLENMQMITDAAVRGLNVLAYTKEMDFAEIFAPTGANINVSVFATEVNGQITSDGMQGADWERARALRNQYGNVGTVMVATNDRIMKWAMEQDWIDVVIPYHLVRTGQKVADYFGYKNYTSVSGDKKTLNYKPGAPTSVSPVEHRNDIIAYVDALQRYGLSPRFADQLQGYEQYLAGELTPNQFRAMNPYYMKLVNETRRSYADTMPVQPVFNTDAAMASIDTMMKQGGYYQPIGGTMEKQSDIAEEITGKIKASRARREDVQFSVRTIADGTKYTLIDTDATLPGDESDSLPRRVRLYMRDHFRGVVLPLGATKGAYVRSESINEYTNPAATINDTAYTAKMVAALELDNLLKASSFVKWMPDDGRHPDAVRGWNTWRTRFAAYNEETTGYMAFEGLIKIKRIARGDVFYDITQIKNITNGIMGQSIIADAQSIDDGNSIADAETDVNPDIRYSLRDPDAISDREILANALESAAQNDEERTRLAAYKEKLADLEEKQKELDKQRGIMRELLFKKGRTKEETETLNKAKNRAKILNEQVARADATLLKLEAMSPIQNVVKREGEKVRKRVQEIAKERIDDIRNRRDTAALRAKISTKAKALDKLLRGGSKTTFVPDDLHEALAEVLQMLTATDNVRGNDRNYVFGNSKNADGVPRFQRLRDAYEAIRKNSGDLAEQYDPGIADEIDKLKAVMDKGGVRYLNSQQLQTVNDVLNHFKHLISNANKIFRNGRMQDIEVATEEFMSETADVTYLRNKINQSGIIKWLRDGQVTAPYFFRRIGGVFGELGNELLNGESTFGVLYGEYKARVQKMLEKYNHKDWATDKKQNRLTLETKGGAEITLTREQALSIYATHERQKRDTVHKAHHLSGGGITLQIDDESLPIFGGIASEDKTVPLTAADIEQINNWLTDEQKAYANEMVALMSGDLADLGNKISRVLHGYSKFREGYYFPYVVDRGFFNIELGGAENAAMLFKNIGFTKSVQDNASKPIIIDDFTKVASQHITNMLMYHSFAIPQDNMMRLLNHHVSAQQTVEKRFERAYGNGAKAYLTQLMRDLYGEAFRRDPADVLLGRAIGRAKRAQVLFSASTAIQQVSSIMRALAHVNKKYFVHMPATGKWNELLKYSGTANIKAVGGFDTGNSRNFADDMMSEKWADDVSDAVSKIGGYIPGEMDKLTWGAIWEAVKREQATETGLSIESEELKRIAGRRFDEVIRLTQVYDSTLSRSQNMRSKTAMMKAFTSFMGEPTVTYNMIYDMLLNRNATKGERGRIAGAVLGNIFLNSLLKAIVTAYRDDDDDKATYWERYITNFTNDVLGNLNPLNYIPVAKDIWSTLLGFTVTRSDAVFAEGFVDLVNLALKEDRKGWEIAKAAVSFLSEISGIPVSNIWREVEGGINTFGKNGAIHNKPRDGWLLNAIKTGGHDTIPFLNKMLPDANERLFILALDGDHAGVEEQRKYIRDYNDKDDKEINTALRAEIKDAYIDGKISAYTAEMLVNAYAPSASKDGESYVGEWEYQKVYGHSYSNMKDAYMDGELTYDEAVAARMKYGGRTEEQAQSTVDGWKAEKDNE